MTKRLFAYFGLTMLGVYTVVFYFGFYGICAAAGLFAVLLLYACFVKKTVVQKSVIVFVAVTVAVSALVFVLYDNGFKSQSEKYNSENVSVTAKVKSDGEKRYGVYNYDLQSERIEDESTNVKIVLYSNYKLACGYGDTIKLNARLTTCKGNYFRSRGFVYAAESESYKLDYSIVKSGEKDISYLPVWLQNKFTEAVKSVIKGEGGELCAAMTFGARAQLSDEINSLFSKTGLSFLIVVSGLHMAIVSGFMLMILKPLRKRRFGNYIACGIVLFCIVFYMLITGLTASVVRSGIALIFALLGIFFSKRCDSYNNLGLAALLLIFLNPYAVGDVGMLLSFSSALGILYFYPRLCRRFHKSFFERKAEYHNEINRTNQEKRKLYFKLQIVLSTVALYVIKVFFVSLSAFVMSLPIVCLTIGYENVSVLLSSVLLTPLTVLIVVFGLLTGLLSCIPVVGILSYFTGAVADFSSFLMIYIVRFINSVPYLRLYLDRNTIWLWLLTFAILMGLAFVLKRGRKNYVLAFAFSLVFLLGICTAETIVHSNNVVMKIIDTGTPCVKISGGGVEALLSYGGDYGKLSELTRKLRSNGGDVKTLIVPDSSLKTSRFAVNIMNEFDVERVMLYHSKGTPLDLESEVMSVKDYTEFYSADVIALDLGKGVKDTIINDGKSTWQYVESGEFSALIAPDKADATRLYESFTAADVVICGNEIKNMDLLGDSETRFITGNAPEDLNIRLGD